MASRAEIGEVLQVLHALYPHSSPIPKGLGADELANAVAQLARPWHTILGDLPAELLSLAVKQVRSSDRKFPATRAARTGLYCLANNLVLTAEDGFGSEGFHRPIGLQNGCYWESSWLHFGQPGMRKNLQSIVALLSDAAADFDVQLYYRIDFGSDWIPAGTVVNSRRAAVAWIDVEFYVLQVKVAFDDQTGRNEDIALDSVSVLYAQRQ